jgi:sugar O-acyltransferase (sialic acid O-acetyltransferase NeuD family)
VEKLLIFPFNGNGLEAFNCIGDQFEVIGFIDDTPEKLGKTTFGIQVFGREILSMYNEAKVLVVPGSPLSFQIRKRVIDDLKIPYNRFATVVSPFASVSSMSKLGVNVLIMAGVIITSNAFIGDHICILPNTVVHHDTQIGDYTLIGSNVTIAGNSRIGLNCYIGSGTSIINNIEIGDKTLIGMGSNVIKSLPNNSKVAGNPARQL